MSTDTLSPSGLSATHRPFDKARAGGSSRLRTVVRGRSEDAGWIRPTLIGLLIATGVLYLWGLSASGYANSFYSAAAQAGSVSWKAFFFGSSDAANSITVDKTPAALWAMALSVRIFGLNSWSILVPQALEGIAAVAMLYLAVRRTSGPQAGLIAGAVLAATPVAALMFRFNNPDSLLVLLLIIAAYCVVRALEHGSTRWLVGAGALVGFGFLTKMLQALLVVPAFAIAYLIVAPNPLRKRILQLLAAGLAMVVAAGWWIAIVELVPASARPYIGGSQNNSILQLTLGYNGFGRLTGNETGSVGGGATAGGQWGSTGWSRLFGSQMGSEIGWLLPTSLILLVAGLWFGRKAIRTDRTRGALIVWGGWLLVTAVIFSYAHGIIHPYYTVALAPAVGGVIGIGAVTLWRHKSAFAASMVLGVTLAITVAWQFLLLDRVSGWQPWLRYAVLTLGVATALMLVVSTQLRPKVRAGLAATAIVVGLIGPGAYSIATAATPHTGAIPSVGPAGYSTGGIGGRGGGGGGGGGGGPAGQTGTGRAFGGGTAPGGTTQGGTGGTTQGGTTQGGTTGTARGGAAGGLLGASTPSAAVVSALTANSSNYTWVAAAVGSNSAAGYQLATQLPVMPIGGFNGSDPSPTLAQFKAYVAAGNIHYFIASGGGGFGSQMGGSNSSSEIASWVESNFSSTTVGGVTLYDLTQS
ncbi:MAG: glycosyl transferase family 39 [Frankiales bacterium]|nr:glycosyl transferase family 39 [Frankiales bacterium]